MKYFLLPRFIFVGIALTFLSCQGGKKLGNDAPGAITSFSFNKPDSSWKTFQYDKSVKCEWEKNAGRNGTGCIVISGNTLHAKWERKFFVETGHDYKITAYAKGEGKALAYLSINDKYSSNMVRGSFDWTLLSLEYTPEKDGMVTVNCNFGYRSGQTIYDGTVWFDDLKIERID